MEPSRSGTKVSQGGYKAFIPTNLPPQPPILLEGELKKALEEATQMLAVLNELGNALPNSDLFIAMYVRKEALLSAQIEGTQASIEDIFDAEASVAVDNINDVEEVINYIKALHFGMEKLKDIPMSLRLIKELHALLLQGTRGKEKQPGEFRKSQNWIGPAGCTLATAYFVPPPPHMVVELMSALEKYMHTEDSDLPVLIDCALLHYQFETIHPFLDGNGRLGRLLITFYLLWKGALQHPLLYLSYYLKFHRQEYYDRLSMTRNTGNYEQWILFFLKGVHFTATSAIETIKQILRLQDTMRTLLIEKNLSSSHAMKLLGHLFYVPIVTVADVQTLCEVTYQTAATIISTFEDLGIVQEVTGQKRAKRYAFKEYLALLSQGAQPL